MADSTDTSTAPPSGGSGENKLTRFIKKNKTLSAVVGVVGGYLLWKQAHKSEGVEEEAPALEAPSGSQYGPAEPVEVSHEAIDQEIGDVRDQVKEEEHTREEEDKRIEEENRDKGEGGGSGENNPGSEGGTSHEDTAHPSVTIHGKTFKGATSSYISGSGKDNGKDYIEYTINFPGRQEHWRFYTATGNWRQVKDSSNGPGTGKKQEKSPPKDNGGGQVITGKPGQGVTAPVKGGGTIGVGKAEPVHTAPPVKQQHPNAVKTGNRCVKGGVGPHKAPAGYRLFCGSDGWIYRVPN